MSHGFVVGRLVVGQKLFERFVGLNGDASVLVGVAGARWGRLGGAGRHEGNVLGDDANAELVEGRGLGKAEVEARLIDRRQRSRLDVGAVEEARRIAHHPLGLGDVERNGGFEGWVVHREVGDLQHHVAFDGGAVEHRLAIGGGAGVGIGKDAQRIIGRNGVGDLGHVRHKGGRHLGERLQTDDVVFAVLGDRRHLEDLPGRLEVGFLNGEVALGDHLVVGGWDHHGRAGDGCPRARRWFSRPSKAA